MRPQDNILSPSSKRSLAKDCRKQKRNLSFMPTRLSSFTLKEDLKDKPRNAQHNINIEFREGIILIEYNISWRCIEDRLRKLRPAYSPIYCKRIEDMANNNNIHSSLSNDSSLLSQDDSLLSSQSTSSFDHEARLSNARVSGSGGNRAEDRDMTEDEVAIMIKNALRKARRAMNNSSPMNSTNDDNEDDISPRSNNIKTMSTDDKSPRYTTVRKSPPRNNKSMSSPKVVNRSRTTSSSNTNADDSFVSSAVSSSIDNTNNNNTTADEIDFDQLPPHNTSAEESMTSDGTSSQQSKGCGPHNDLAKRIEEEIHSARAFAERKYYSGSTSSIIEGRGGGGGGGGLSTPRSNTTTTTTTTNTDNNNSRTKSSFSVDTELTPLTSNITSNTLDPVPSPTKSKSSPRSEKKVGKKESTARERMARSKDKIAAANEKLLKKTTTGSGLPPTSPGVNTLEGGGTALPTTPYDAVKTPGNDEFDAILQVSPAPDKKIGRYTRGSSTPIINADGMNNNSTVAVRGSSPKNKGTLSNDPDEAELDRTTEGVGEEDETTTMMNNAGKENLHTSTNNSSLVAGPPPPPPNTNSNKPQQHRQVLFRHPYPLPPPPPLPRSDTIIITSHSAPSKNINIKWIQPDNDLQALIEAAGEEYNLVRRSNACGALKVLASKDSNKPRLARTTGLLDVLVKASYDDAVDSDALDARTRAVTTLLYLSEAKDNRLMIAKHTGLLECLVKVITEDTGEARWRATSALATLAKTPGNRGLMGRVEGLASCLGELMIIGVSRKEEEEVVETTTKNNESGKEEGGTESREDDNSTFVTGTQPSYDETTTMDDDGDHRMLTNTYSGTFTDGTGTFTEDDLTYQNTYDEEDTHDSENEGGSENEEEGNDDDDESSKEDGHDNDSMMDYDDDGSVQEEEGVEMQISSLKKLNIENASDFLAKSQMSACATLIHLTKHCANAPTLCLNDGLLDNIIFLAGTFECPLHTRCIEMLCNFTRFPSNNARLASMPSCVSMLLHCGKSKIAEDRMWSIRTIQNLCSDASSKVGLATGSMLSLLSTAAMRKDYEEQFAAVGALMNLSTEPGSIVPLTNTKTVVATLVHLAHSPNTPGAVRKIACDSLATIGLWLQTLASAGTVPEEIPFSPLPTHSATGWLRWEN